jgi:hypothetical protein
MGGALSLSPDARLRPSITETRTGLGSALCQVGFTNREHLGLAPEASFPKPSYY